MWYLTIFRAKIKHYIPQISRQLENNNYWREELCKEWKVHKGLNRVKAMRIYMETIAEWPFFGAHFFPAKYRDSNTSEVQGIPEEVIFVIRCDGLQILEAETLELYIEYDFMEITNWGCSDRIFVLSLGEVHAIKKIYFHAPQAPVIAWMLNCNAFNMANKHPSTESLTLTFDFAWDKRKRLVSSFPKKK